jgi:hypothetical protein
MSMTLRISDARAVDLILDRAAVAQGTSGTMLFAGDPGVSGEQVAAVERVLHLLDALPAGEPPHDLLRRTLSRVESGMPAQPQPHRAQPRDVIEAGRPVA